MAQVSLVGSELLCEYVEPSQNADGSQLTDLAKTRVYYQLLGQTPVVAAEVPASSPNGGGTISQRIVVPVAANTEAFVDIWFTALDDVDNESAKSDVYQVQIDKLAPAPPR